MALTSLALLDALPVFGFVAYRKEVPVAKPVSPGGEGRCGGQACTLYPYDDLAPTSGFCRRGQLLLQPGTETPGPQWSRRLRIEVSERSGVRRDDQLSVRPLIW